MGLNTSVDGNNVFKTVIKGGGQNSILRKDSPLQLPILRGVVSEDSESPTSFVINELACEDENTEQFADDMFNSLYSVWIYNATSITANTIVDITDYDASTGTFTTTTAGANYTAGDDVVIALNSLLSTVSLSTIWGYIQLIESYH